MQLLAAYPACSSSEAFLVWVGLVSSLFCFFSNFGYLSVESNGKDLSIQTDNSEKKGKVHKEVRTLESIGKLEIKMVLSP